MILFSLSWLAVVAAGMIAALPPPLAGEAEDRGGAGALARETLFNFGERFAILSVVSLCDFSLIELLTIGGGDDSSTAVIGLLWGAAVVVDGSGDDKPCVKLRNDVPVVLVAVNETF